MSDAVEQILASIVALSAEERALLFERLRDEGVSPSPQAATQLHFASAEFEGPADYILTFDGGSQGNPGPGYGSYAVARAQGGQQDIVRLDFGRQMTNPHPDT